MATCYRDIGEDVCLTCPRAFGTGHNGVRNWPHDMDASTGDPQRTIVALPPRWVMWAAALLVAALIALVAFEPDLRSLAAATWREMVSISPLFLVLLFSFKILQALFSALVWRNLLHAAWPESNLSYRLVLAVDQGQDVVNTVMPMRGGTWAMLGIFDLSIPRARPPKLLAVWGVQNLAFLLFASITYAITAIGLPGQVQERSGVMDVITSHPKVTIAVVGSTVAALAGVAYLGRSKLADIRKQVREGFAILGTPKRYVRLVFLPSLASHLCKIAAYAVLLDAFGIPLSVWTLALALGSHALAGAVRFTPAGLGTTQAIDVVALQAYASAEVVTAYSLSEIAVTAISALVVSVVALISAIGWRHMRRLFRLSRRGALTETLNRLSRLQHAIQTRRAAHRHPRP